MSGNSTKINKNHYAVPQCAWTRKIGDYPKKCASNSPKRGVALGGFGAGSFMYNLSGSFGPWQSFKNTVYQQEWLDSAAFHIHEKVSSKKPVIKCLANDPGLKSAWSQLNKQQADYYALQPKGWITYQCFDTDVSMKFFSPIIPHNYRETTFPTAVWEFKLHNPLSVSIELSIMLTFSGVYPDGEKTHRDFKNFYHQEAGYHALVLRSEQDLGEWCLAVQEKDCLVSHVLSWDARKNGADIWKQFSRGHLGNCQIDHSHSGCALAVIVQLQPGQTKYLPFVISWDFPAYRFGKGTEWWRKYTDYFGKTADQAFFIARETLQNYQKWDQAMDQWLDPVVRNVLYPDWLKCTALNELYYCQFGGIFYSSGLKSRIPGHTFSSFKHLFFEMESIGYPFCNTLDVRHYSSIVYARFWPEIEKELLLLFARAILKNDGCQTPHDSGNPFKDPFIEFDDYGTSKLNWKDLSSKFIQQCWRYYYLYKDRKFLSRIWEACLQTYHYMKTTDKNNDKLPDNYGSDNTYDSWGLYGTSLLCGGLWIGALEAMKKMAEVMDPPLIKEIDEWLRQARENLEKQLWMDKDNYYRIDTESKENHAVMSDGLNGQRYCESFGLPDILDKNRMKAHLKRVYLQCVVPMKDYNKDGIGDMGAVNGVNRDGKFLNTNQSDEFWTGSSYFLSASMYHAGLIEEALMTAYGVYYTTYINEKTAYWFNTPESYDRNGQNPRPHSPEQYQRPRAVWELLLEMDDPFI